MLPSCLRDSDSEQTEKVDILTFEAQHSMLLRTLLSQVIAISPTLELRSSQINIAVTVTSQPVYPSLHTSQKLYIPSYNLQTSLNSTWNNSTSLLKLLNS
jgi:sigma54-dependent transcription regulator